MRRQRSPRYRRVKRWADNALVATVIGLFGLGAAAVISGHYQVRPVLSGSMQPELRIGGVVITEAVPTTMLQVGDVVVFHQPDQPKELVVHRVLSLTPGPSGMVMQTKGDANRMADPWKASLRGPTAYRAVFAVPLVGYVPVWAHSPAGRQMLTRGGLILIVGAGGGSLIYWRRSARTSTALVARPGDLRHE